MTLAELFAPDRPTAARPLRPALVLALATALSGCGAERFGFEGTQNYSGPDSVVATGQDQGVDDSDLIDGQAGIAYDPDGCQVWIIDDGIEGYATARFDPETGLPVCDDRHPPGTLLGPYESDSAPFADAISGPGKNLPVE
jgi:hypothetical protein